MVAAPASHLTIASLGLQRNGRWLFRNLSWEVPRGKVVAVVGASGAGKSSLLGCLSGMIPASEGQLTYCCQAGCSHDPASYQRRIGIVFQHFALSLNSSS
jgi:ABC-type multidrug transport system ATPase subunit